MPDISVQYCANSSVPKLPRWLHLGASPGIWSVYYVFVRAQRSYGKSKGALSHEQVAPVEATDVPPWAWHGWLKSLVGKDEDPWQFIEEIVTLQSEAKEVCIWQKVLEQENWELKLGIADLKCAQETPACRAGERGWAGARTSSKSPEAERRGWRLTFPSS